MKPSPAETNGRGQLGRFGTGNKFGTGNPHASKIQKLRAAMLSAVAEKDVKAIVMKLIGLAQEGDLKAAKMILDLVGRPEGDTPAAATTPSAATEINNSNFQEIKNAWLAKLN